MHHKQNTSIYNRIIYSHGEESVVNSIIINDVGIPFQFIIHIHSIYIIVFASSWQLPIGN